jgi:hypothetical protein
MRVKLDSTWERLGLPAGELSTCSADACEAEVARHELDGVPGAEAVLRLNMSHNVGRYLVFKRGGRAWRLVGFVEHDFNRYADSTYHVARAGGRNWLVVRGQGGSGTGFALYGETWYEVGRGGLRPVLYYPAEGQVYPWPSGVGRKYRARAVGALGPAVALHYSVTYESMDYMKDVYKPLYRNSHRAVYVWDDGRREFVFDARRSDISEAEIAAVAEIQDAPAEGEQVGGSEFFSGGDAWKRGGYDVFLKYNLRSLLRVARGRDAGRREWLRGLLPDFADTPEKRTLEGALGARGGARR